MSPTEVPRPPHTTALGSRRFLGGATGVALGTALGGGLTAAPASATALGGADSPVRTESGLVTGTAAALDGVTVYEVIPYAASTAGAHRSRRRSGPGSVRAGTCGSSCPQGGRVGPTMSEARDPRKPEAALGATPGRRSASRCGRRTRAPPRSGAPPDAP
ncbi:hypothetical protein ACFWM5_39830 [Streptomyces bobili]|uniref:hypothetical protein n=1 Tax=Streptomyces bobili TaxID=67280 RepID=UPI003650676E